jgi:hypothetical protein
VRAGDSHANTNCDSNSYAYADSYAYCDGNSYAYTDGYANGHSDSYAYTDSYANGHSNSYAYTDSYAYVDAYGPAETKPDTKATSDTAASPVGASRKRLCGNSRENLASSPRGGGSASLKTMAGESPKAQDISGKAAFYATR